jgi:hypothetical protein
MHYKTLAGNKKGQRKGLTDAEYKFLPKILLNLSIVLRDPVVLRCMELLWQRFASPRPSVLSCLQSKNAS